MKKKEIEKKLQNIERNVGSLEIRMTARDNYYYLMKLENLFHYLFDYLNIELTQEITKIQFQKKK